MVNKLGILIAVNMVVTVGIRLIFYSRGDLRLDAVQVVWAEKVEN